MNPRTVIASDPLVGIQGWLRIADIPRRTSHSRRSACLALRGASSASIGPRKAWNWDGVRAVRRLAAYLKRSPDTATAEDLRAFQLHMVETGTAPPTINSTLIAAAMASSMGGSGFSRSNSLWP